jgi:hypothetical protein
MARSVSSLIGAVFFQLAIGDVPSAVQVASNLQIDAAGTVVRHKHATSGKTDNSMNEFVDMVTKAQAAIAATRRTARMVRTEVKRHQQDVQQELKNTFEKAMGLLELEAVDCGSILHDERDPTQVKLCRILTGTNLQVAGKLERAVKGLSLRPKTANATEMVVADKDEENLLSHLKGALWDMWFCAKRVDPPCDPMKTTEAKIQAAREEAFDALHSINAHAKDFEARAAAEAQKEDAKAAQSLVEIQESHEDKNHHEKQAPTETSSSAWAAKTLNSVLTAPNVTGKLWDAIHMAQLDSVLEKDVINIEKDEDGNMRKLKANMVILHECATMPDCTGPNQPEGCCVPARPTQAKYEQARNDAYRAYAVIQNDDDLQKQAYAQLLGNIGNKGVKKKKHHYGTTPPPADQDTTLYPLSQPPAEEDTNSSNTTKATPKPTEPEGQFLLYGLVAVTGVVVLVVFFLMFKTSQINKSGGGGGGGAAAQWAGEGYGEGEGYGQY